MPAMVVTEVAAGDTNAFRTAIAAIDDAKLLFVKTEGNTTFILSKT